MDAAQLRVLITANAAQAQATIAQTAGMLSSGGMLGVAVLGASALMIGTAAVATKMAGDFQKGITSLQTGAGESANNIALVSAGIKQLAIDTGTSTQQLIAGMYMIESGGFHGAAGLAILKAAAEGAKVGNADLGVVADTTDTILKNFGENGALTASQAVNALITTVANGKTHLEDLGNSLSGVLPAGAAAGLGLKDVLGAMAELTNVGIPAAEAATYLRQMIIALEAPSSGAVTALQKIGITTDELAAHMKKGLPDALQFIEKQLEAHGIKPGTAQYVASLREISGGTRQMQGMLNLMGPHLGDFTDKVNKIGAAASTTGDKITGWDLVQKTFNQSMDKFGAGLEVMMTNLGEKLLPVLTPFVSWLASTALPAIQNFAGWLGDRFTQAVKAISQQWEDWTKKGGPLYGVLQALPGILAGIHHYFDLLGKVWQTQIQPGLVQMLPVLKILGIIIGIVIVGAIATAIVLFLLIAGVITGVIFIVAKLVQGIGWAAQQIPKAWDLVKKNVGEVWDWITTKIHDAWTLVTTNIQNALKWITDHVKDAWNLVKTNIQNVLTWIEGIPGKLLSLGEQMMKNLAQGIKNAAGNVTSALKNVPGLGGIVGGIQSVIPHFATGGTMAQSGLALVGEQGPEMVYLPAGARVSPNPGGSSSGGGYANGQPIVVNLVVDGQRLAQATVKHMPHALHTATGRRDK